MCPYQPKNDEFEGISLKSNRNGDMSTFMFYEIYQFFYDHFETSTVNHWRCTNDNWFQNGRKKTDKSHKT